MKSQDLNAINCARNARQPIAVVCDLTTGVQRIVNRAEAEKDALKEPLMQKWQSGKSGTIIHHNAEEEKEYFIQIYRPLPRLVIIGAVHIAQTLVMLAQQCQFDVTVIDPRTAFATKERFKDVRLFSEWPQDVLDEVRLDPFTALAALTHDPKIDDLPLKAALEAGCFYTGALGSRKTHGKRKTRLLEAGVNEALFNKIDAPIGMDIGAANPAEIAVAIMAQVIDALHKEVV